MRSAAFGQTSVLSNNRRRYPTCPAWLGLERLGLQAAPRTVGHLPGQAETTQDGDLTERQRMRHASHEETGRTRWVAGIPSWTNLGRIHPLS